MEAFESAWLLRANDDALSLTEYVVRVGRTVRTAAQGFERSCGSLPPEHDCESGKVQRRGGVVVIAQFNQLDDQVVEYGRRAWSLTWGFKILLCTEDPCLATPKSCHARDMLESHVHFSSTVRFGCCLEHHKHLRIIDAIHQVIWAGNFHCVHIVVSVHCTRRRRACCFVRRGCVSKQTFIATFPPFPTVPSGLVIIPLIVR